MEKIVSYLSRLFMIIAGAALLLLVLLATGNVTLRIFHMPYAGTYEIVAFLGALVIAGALAHTQRRRDHIMVDIVTDRFPPTIKRILDAVSDLMSALLFGIAAWQIYQWAGKLKISGELSETLQIKFYPFVYATAAGFGLLTLVLLLQMFRAVLRKEEVV
jgi:TRAP-type C4-dicarboxylate transport system permease small subunit